MIRVCDGADRAAWIEARRHYVCASDVPVLLGPSPWSDPLRLFLDKRGELPEIEETEAMRWGRLLEPTILGAFSDVLGKKVDPNVALYCEDDGVLAATPDGWVVGDDGIGWIPVEAKAVSAYAADDWRDGPPPHYAAQVQTQLAVCGRGYGWIVALIGGQRLVHHRVERDEDAIARIRDVAGRFIRAVRAGEPPYDLASEAARAAQIGTETPGRVVLLGREEDEIDHRLLVLDAEISERTEERDVLLSRLRCAIGTAERGVLPGGAVEWVWKTDRRGVRSLRRREGRREH